MNSGRYIRISRIVTFTLSLVMAGCSLYKLDQTTRYAEAKFSLDSANFETAVVHAAGEASCLYILFSIPVCKNQNIATLAWQKMRYEAHMEGKSAQFVNVFEDHSLRWNFFYLFYQDYYSVSASVIVYKQSELDTVDSHHIEVRL